MGSPPSRDEPVVPGSGVAWTVALSSALLILTTYWLALLPRADDAQSAFVTWINDPPQPLAAALAVTNVLFRPVPLAGIAVALGGWIVVTARGTIRWEVLRAAVTSVAMAEVITQTLKRLADQPRPTAYLPGLDVHGYPKDPYGNAYPSAHTSVAVGLVASLWPWLTWPQRVVGIAVAAAVAFNRMYIGAHWPIDVVGGAAIGLLSGSLCWLVAARWPISRPTPESSLQGR